MQLFHPASLFNLSTSWSLYLFLSMLIYAIIATTQGDSQNHLFSLLCWYKRTSHWNQKQAKWLLNISSRVLWLLKASDQRPQGLSVFSDSVHLDVSHHWPISHVFFSHLEQLIYVHISATLLLLRANFLLSFCLLMHTCQKSMFPSSKKMHFLSCFDSFI